MEEFKHLFDSRKKTREDLVQLYVTVVRQKPRFQYDPKKLIFDLFPLKKNIYSVFMPKKEFSLSQSREDFGKLEIREHRFINFLKFSEFTDEEINKIFESHERLTGADELEDIENGLEVANKMFKRGYRGKALGLMRSLSELNDDLVPEKYQYTKEELYSFIASLTPPIEFNITSEELNEVRMLTEKDIENLYKESQEVHA